MKSPLLLCLLVSATSAAADDAAGLRGLKDRHAHKGPRPARIRNNEPEAEPTVVETVEEVGKMKIKQAKMERAKKPNPKHSIVPPAPTPPPELIAELVQSYSYSYQVPDNDIMYLGLTEDEPEEGEEEEEKKKKKGHDFKMEVKNAKKQGRKHEAPAPVSSPAEDDNLPPAPAAVASTEDEEETTTTKKQKGRDKKERKKAAKMAAKGLLKGGVSSTEEETDGGMGRMSVPKKAERKKRGSFASVEGEGEDESGSVNVDVKSNKKKFGGRKQHKKNKHEATAPAPEIETAEPQVEEEEENVPAGELASKVNWPPTMPPVAEPVTTPAPTPAPTSEPTPEPTPAPVTPEPTTLPPVAQVVVEEPPAALPTMPACPMPWDPTRSNTNNPYTASEKVEVQSHIFECHALYVTYCNVAEWDDSLLDTNPNALEMWNNAWTHVGPCA